MCSTEVKLTLLKTFCSPMYGAQLWWNYTAASTHKLHAAYNYTAASTHKLHAAYNYTAASTHKLHAAYNYTAASTHKLHAAYNYTAASTHKLHAAYNYTAASTHKLHAAYNYTVASTHKLHVAYNNVFRLLHRQPKYCSASTIFVKNHIPNSKTMIRNTVYKFMLRLDASYNKLVIALVNSDLKWLSRILRHSIKMLYIHNSFD